ncbi:hypothetical protein HOM50_02955 [bacterium]|nr:hypothetical protein [bacterium]MBT5015336.1 hypothetical protein [bacterium]
MKKTSMHHPGKILVLSIIATIVTGTLLLALPVARHVPMSFMDLLFTATSTTTVCGLFTVPIDKFTTFGHVIIFFLMQIGGLGLITMTLFFMSLFTKLGLKTQLIAGKLLEIERMTDIKDLLIFICALSLIVETIGAFCVFFTIKEQYDTVPAIFLSIFHSVSAFCNAGITLFPHGMQGYSNHPVFLMVTAILILFGSLGFVPWYEIVKYLGIVKFKESQRSLSLHSKIVLTISAIFILFATGLFWLLESHNTLANQGVVLSIINAFFNATSIRSTGFLSVPFAELQMATVFIIMIFSFIGSSSGSTGSGIKTTTFALLLFTAKSLLMSRKEVEIKGRRIPHETVYRASATVFLAVALIIFTIFLLLISEHNWSFLDIAFESIASFANLGITTGITAFLSFFGKIMIMITMVAGRIGTLTLALAVVSIHDKKKDYTYPEGKVLIS